MNFKSFIQEFNSKKGTLVLLSGLIEKVGGLFLIIIATNLITKSEFGFISYAITALDFMFPFIGFGVHQGLIRYGSLSKSQIDKKQLFKITLLKGLKYSFFMMLLFALLTPLITINKKSALIYLLILTVQLVSLFLYEILRIYARLINLNKLYASITLLKTISLVIFTYLLTLKFQGIGYVISFSVIPLLISIYYIYKLKLLASDVDLKVDFKLKEFISYGLYTSFGGVLSKLLFAVDILLIGNILIDEKLIAHYKIATVLPFSFLFLASSFIRTGFVKIANKSLDDKTYIKNYYLNYLKIFSLLSLLVVVFFYFFSDYLFLLFGKDYHNEYNLMFIFSIGTAGALLFRIPLGNILSAIGWPKINTLNSFIVLIINFLLSYYLIKKMGIVGAAIATASMFWLSGLLSLISFMIYLKRK